MCEAKHDSKHCTDTFWLVCELCGLSKISTELLSTVRATTGLGEQLSGNNPYCKDCKREYDCMRSELNEKGLSCHVWSILVYLVWAEFGTRERTLCPLLLKRPCTPHRNSTIFELGAICVSNH